ncbi:MAG: Flp pilus assembly protein CpaB [Deltaproteobacteria bacterium]|nr:Flp pilus assembly protein CpaB [Deltaproteobacteria bacterium]
MRRYRGLIALALCIFLGLIATKAVYWYLTRPKPVLTQVKTEAKQPERPLTFSEKFPQGMRIMAIKLDNDSAMPGQIERGDMVDVVATSRIPDKNDASVTRIILEGVEIYDTEEEAGDSSKQKSKRQEERVISLLVSPEDAVTLTAASESARLSIIVRNKSDEDLSGDLTATYSYNRGVEKITGEDNPSSIQPIPGMRAITITAKNTDGVQGVLNPGDRVDIIITSPWSRFSTSETDAPGAKGTVTETSLSSKIFLQDVEILATEKILDLSVGMEEPVQRVTLLVTPDQAVKLTAASDATKKSVLRLVSRHPDDRKRDEIGYELIDILADKKVYHRVDIYKGIEETFKNFFH